MIAALAMGSRQTGDAVRTCLAGMGAVVGPPLRFQQEGR
jgi:hypothetical protein